MERWVDSSYLSEHYGLSRRWVCKETKAGRFPGRKFGNRWRYSLKKLKDLDPDDWGDA